jgi:hypothetical protein
MATLYLLGNLLGRALVSYALVWLVCWLCSRFNWRAALRRSSRWYSVLGVLVLTLGGLGAALVRHGGIH